MRTSKNICERAFEKKKKKKKKKKRERAKREHELPLETRRAC